MEELLGSVADVRADQAFSWAVVAKWDRRVKKNILVRKFLPTKKRKKMKDEVSQALDGIQITNQTFTNEGNIALNFETENTRDEAAKKISLEKISTKSAGKMKPKKRSSKK